MDAGGLAQMSHNNNNNTNNNFASNGLGMTTSGLASRRNGGQNIKPLSFDTLKNANEAKDNGILTPRTARGHLLAGLRTAPKTASAATFPTNPASPTTAAPANSHMRSRNFIASAIYGGNESLYNGPKTSVPRYAQQQQQQQAYNPMMGFAQQFTPDQVLAPPELNIGEDGVDGLDPYLYEKLVATNLHLAQQQQRLQQQLLTVQQAAQQFSGLSLHGIQSMQQAYGNMYQQQHQQQHQQQPQQQFKNMQQPSMASAMQSQGNIYAFYNPMTGQQEYYLDQGNNGQMNTQPTDQYNLAYQQLLLQQQQQQQQQLQQQLLQHQQQSSGMPRVQVSPPPMENGMMQNGFRNPSPPRRFDSPVVENPAPLPPPSANAFRRGHKKSTSLANNGPNSLSIATHSGSVSDALKSAGPKTASFPMTPMTGTYMPGQQRAGEHPTRQPRGPPSLDELKTKPTSRHDGSKNFVARARRSAVHNLVRAGMERRKDTRSSGSISPISESAEEILAASPLLAEPDNDSDSVRSGSGSLNGEDVECSLPSSRTSTGSWGAIGSDRPGSRHNRARKSADSVSSSASGSDNEGANGSSSGGSFASVFKNAGKVETEAAAAHAGGGQRKAPMLVLTSAEKRKNGVLA